MLLEASLLLLLAQTPAPLEMVVLPLRPIGVKEKSAIRAWKRVSKKLSKGKKKLGVGMNVHSEAKNAIYSARKRTWECKDNSECLAAFGESLEADLIISGTVSKKTVTLFVIDVRSGKRMFGAKSTKRFAKRSLKKKADAAMKGVVKELPNALARLETEQDKRGAALDDDDDDALAAAAAVGAATAAGAATAGAAAAGGATVGGATAGGAATGAGSEGAASPAADSPVAVAETPGTDGSSAETPTRLEPAKAEAAPEPKPAPVAIAQGSPPPAEEESLTSSWVFWTSIVVATAAGSATAVALASGTKGGPSLDGQTGSIRGTY